MNNNKYNNVMTIIENETAHLKVDDDENDNPIFDLMVASIDFEQRKQFVAQYSWAVPSRNAIQKIVEFVKSDKILEIGSGFGLWAYLLSLNNVNIVATDNFSSHTDKNKERYFVVDEISNMEAVEKYTDCNALMFVWPPYEEPMAHDALTKFTGTKLIFIGEPEGYSCADDQFFEEIKKNWKLEEHVNIPKWWGMHDALYLYSKK